MVMNADVLAGTAGPGMVNGLMNSVIMNVLMGQSPVVDTSGRLSSPLVSICCLLMQEDIYMVTIRLYIHVYSIVSIII